MNELRVYFHGLESSDPMFLGRLGYGRGDNYTHFEMNPEFLRLGIGLSPFHLKPETGLQAASLRPFAGLHGLFADSLPDGWGRLLMDRTFRQRGMSLDAITPLHRLAFIGSRAMGALSYVPNTEAGQSAADLLDLPAIGLEATRQYQGEAVEVLDEFVGHAAPSGGARPKMLIGLSDAGDSIVTGAEDLPNGYSHWIAKFPTGNAPDDRSAGAIEHLFAKMARRAGIRMAETRLVPGQKDHAYFLTRRFDRLPGNRRLHVHSVAGLVHADFRVPDFDYLELLKLSDLLTKSHAEKVELFRRMVFNVVTGNRDDHTKNFAFVMQPNGRWVASPAYDLTYNLGIRGHHSMTIEGKGRDFTREDCLALAHRVSIPRKSAIQIMQEVSDAVSMWAEEASHYAIPKEQAAEIQEHIQGQCSRLLAVSALLKSGAPAPVPDANEAPGF